jgi:hypothetical protein
MCLKGTAAFAATSDSSTIPLQIAARIICRVLLQHTVNNKALKVTRYADSQRRHKVVRSTHVTCNPAALLYQLGTITE